ncbi:hypothetical protein LINPERHAP2_LOCUS21266 [Linum perenne]
MRSKESQPKGSPSSEQGKSRSKMSILRKVRRRIWELNRAALTGVVTTETWRLRWARSLAMSIIGTMWPCTMKGKRTKWERW